MSRSVRDDYQWKGRPEDGPDPASIDPLFPAAHYQDGRDLNQCDGCRRKLPLKGDIHVEDVRGQWKPVQSCQASRYLTK